MLLALALLKLPTAQPVPWTPLWHAWKELGDYLWTKRELRLILLLMTLVAVLAMPYYVLLPKLARIPWELDPAASAFSWAPAAWGPFWAPSFSPAAWRAALLCPPS